MQLMERCCVHCGMRIWSLLYRLSLACILFCLVVW